MTRRFSALHLAALGIDRDSGEPLYRQLYLAIREAVLAGRLAPGSRLPPSRTLARDLGLSRNTVVLAFEQLLAEGYVEGKVGAGTFVSKALPETLLAPWREASRKVPLPGRRPPRLSERGARLAAIRSGPFTPGIPEVALFPFDDWARLLARHWRRPSMEHLVSCDIAGFRPLREAIAAYLGAARSVSCNAEQVLIVSGSQQALDLAARVLIDPGDEVWMEEPGYAGIRGALIAAGARLVPVPVDDEGLSVAAGRCRAPEARLAFVTPSHHYPLGVTMTLKRRLELLDWARSADAYIVEDDFDSEYRYSGRPLAALQGLDADGRVIYVGTMSKVMFPGLRLGYLVVPEDLIDPFRGVRRLLDSYPSSIPQAALAEFIGDGHLAAHIRRMRTLYAERQAVLLDAAAPLGNRLQVAPDESGMHLVGFLAMDVDDAEVSRRAAALGVDAPPLSRFYEERPLRRGLLLGYAGVAEPTIRQGIAALGRALAAS